MISEDEDICTINQYVNCTLPVEAGESNWCFCYKRSLALYIRKNSLIINLKEFLIDIRVKYSQSVVQE